MSDKKHKVNPLTGELQEYIFEYNGILALRNFQTKLDGERLILHHADDVNFSLLETLVSEVEINGVVYDNPTAAQEALTRLTFNQNRPTILPQEERALITNALQRGDYIGTARDLFNLINNKVDKVPGKMLSSNDFTNEHKQKLEGLDDYDINLDNSTTELILKKGEKVVNRISLMFLNDEGTKLFYNSETKSLELKNDQQEVLTSIPVSHFVNNIPTNVLVENGKIKLKAGQEVIDENTISYNDLSDKPNLNYAPENHSHSWDDIENKPNNLATTQNIEDAINNIQIGGRNLLRNSGQKITNNNYDIAVYELTEKIEEGEEVTITIKGKLGTGKTAFAVYNSGGHLELGVLTKKENNLYQGIFKWINKKNQVITDGRTLNIWTYYSNVDVESTIEWIKLERGNKPTDWTPAPEDFLPKNVSIEENWTATKEWADSTIFTQGSCNVELNQLPHLASISFRRTFVGEAVTFTCAGKQIIYTGDTSFNGGDGSTAVVSIWNNKCYIDIRNI